MNLFAALLDTNADPTPVDRVALEGAVADIALRYAKQTQLETPPLSVWGDLLAGKGDPRQIAAEHRRYASAVTQSVGSVFNGRFRFTPDDQRSMDDVAARGREVDALMKRWKENLRKPTPAESARLAVPDQRRLAGAWVGQILHPQTGLPVGPKLCVLATGSRLVLRSEDEVLMTTEFGAKRATPEIDGRVGLTHWWGALQVYPMPYVTESIGPGWYLYQPATAERTETLTLRLGDPQDPSKSGRHDNRQLQLVLTRDDVLATLHAPIERAEEAAALQALIGHWRVTNGNGRPLRGRERVDYEFTADRSRKALVEPDAAPGTPSKAFVVMPYALRNVVRRGETLTGEIDWGTPDMLEKGVFTLSGDVLWISLGNKGEARPSDYAPDEGSRETLVFQRRGTEGTLAPPRPEVTRSVSLPVGAVLKGTATNDGVSQPMTLTITARKNTTFEGITKYDAGSAKVVGRIQDGAITFDEYERLTGRVAVPRRFEATMDDGTVEGAWKVGRDRGRFELSVQP